MKRKLATIQEISKISVHPNADKLEIACVKGWQTIVKKGEFKKDDKVIYLEIDSLIPIMPWSDFLKDKNKPNDRVRLKTIKLRGERSQGLVVSLDVLREYNIPDYRISGYEVNTDLTEEMNILKYELPVPANLSGIIKRHFPSCVPKTDELRVQSYPEVLDEFRGKKIYISVKMDGSSGTFIHKEGEIDVCSRNLSLKENDTNSFWKVFRKYNLEEILKSAGDFAVQGEVCGPGIQKNRAGLDEIDLFIFNIYDVKKGRYLDYEDFMLFSIDNNLQTVPIVTDNMVFEYTLEELLLLAEDIYPISKKQREGIVIRPLKNFYSKVLGGRATFKVINNKFLEQNEDA